MSGTVTSNVFKASGVIAATPGGLDWSTAVVTGSKVSMTNLVSNSGVVASDVSGVGTGRNGLAAANYSFSA